MPWEPMLVIGGTGILGEVARTLAGEQRRVLAVGRDPGRCAAFRDRMTAGGLPPSGSSQLVDTLAADTTTPAGARAVAARGSFARAVIYAPAVTPAILPILLEAVRGRSVLVATSVAADPATASSLDEAAERVRTRPGDAVVLLGWTGPAGDPTWHTAGEIAAAALAAYRTGADQLLGRIRPWSERPGRPGAGLAPDLGSDDDRVNVSRAAR